MWTLIDWWTLDGAPFQCTHCLIKTYDPSATYHLKLMLSCNMIALLLAIQIFSIMQVDGGIWAHLISFFYFYSIKYLLIGVGRKKKEASIHDILKNLRVLRRNTDEGQHQDLDAGVVNYNHYWLAILNNLNLRVKSSFRGFWFFLESRVSSRGKPWGPGLYDRWGKWI